MNWLGVYKYKRVVCGSDDVCTNLCSLSRESATVLNSEKVYWAALSSIDDAQACVHFPGNERVGEYNPCSQW